jgi:hypothetical protein
MNTKQGRDKLKTYFETGDRPTEDEFSEFIDSGINQLDDNVHAVKQADETTNVGIGTASPSARLEVDGNVNVTKHIFGKKAAGTEDFLMVSNSAEIQLFGSQHTNRKGAMFLIGDHRQGAGSGKISFDQRISDTQWRNNMLIDANGNVGIGTTTPGNKLEIVPGSGSNTGLKLAQDAGIGKLLVSDAQGNASWKMPTTITDGLWKVNGNNIENGNSGDVVVGKPTQLAYLNVHGNVVLNNKTLFLREKGDVYHGLSYNSVTDGPHLFGSNGGALTVKNPNKSPVEQSALKWDVNLNVNVYGNLKIHDKTLLFRSDDNHGVGWFGSAAKPFASNVIDGPVMFGFSGGALGTKNDSNEKIAMQWFSNQRVDFKGKVTVNGVAPFVIKYYIMKFGIRPSSAGAHELYPKIPNEPNNASPANNTNCAYEFAENPPSEWNAIIGNFSFNHIPASEKFNQGQISFWIEPNAVGNKWILNAHFPNGHESEKMVTILFIRKEFM